MDTAGQYSDIIVETVGFLTLLYEQWCIYLANAVAICSLLPGNKSRDSFVL